MNHLTRICLVASFSILLSLLAPTAFTQSTSSPGTMEMKAFVAPAYKPGLPLDDHEALLKALKRTCPQKHLVKIPVLVQLSQDGMRGWTAAYIGTDTDATDAIAIHLDDTALGLSLADRLHQYCPDGEWCKLWLVGYWQDALVRNDECSPAMKKRALSLSIRHIAGAQAPGDAALAYIAKPQTKR